MDLSRRIASVLGPALVFVTASEAFNLEIWAGVDPTVVYLNGLLLVIAGLLITTTHNVWSLKPSVLVTVSGWLLLLAGLYRLFFPTAPQMASSAGTYVLLAALASLGLALTLYAFVEPRAR